MSALARLRGKDLGAMVPPKLRTMDRYIASLLSTAGEAGSYLPIADTVGDTVATDAVGMLAAALDTPLWQGLMADLLKRGKKVKRDWTFDGVFTVIHGPERCPDAVVDLLVRLREERGCTVVMITHEPDLAARVATRSVRIEDGRLFAVTAGAR